MDSKYLPYRNSIKENKTFKLDKNIIYNQYVITKPNGFWYEIEDGAFQWGEINWGKYIYDVELDTSKIIIIKNYNDYLDFHNKYGMTKNFRNEFSIKLLDWEKVSKDYSGFEVINYDSIKKKLREDFKKTDIASWLDAFDFSSGCIWNLNDLKTVKYNREYELN